MDTSFPESQLKLYVNDTSQPSRAVMVLCEIGHTDIEKSDAEQKPIPYEKVVIKIFEGEQYTNEYKKINPAKQVPAMVDGDFILAESHSILRYIAETRKLPDHWYPKDLKQRARVDEYLDWHHTHLRSGVHLYLMKKILYPIFGKEVSEKELKNLEKILHLSLKQMEDRLTKHKYLCGDEISIADISAFCEVMDTKLSPDIDISKYNHVVAWMNRMLLIPAVKKVHEPLLKQVEGLGPDTKAKL